MNKETARKLLLVPEIHELIAHLTAEAQKLNSLQGLEDLSITDRAYEVTARLRAFETIKRMLSPLVDVEDEIVRANPKEYVT